MRISLALALPVVFLGCAQPATPKAASAGAIGVYTSDQSGFDTHTYFYDTGKEVVVFDAQFTPALAEKAISAIRARTASPIHWVVVTHPNPDKFNGASAFQAIGAKVVASKATAAAIPGVHAYKKAFFVDVAKMFTSASYPAEARVDVTFEGTFSLAGGAVVLRELSHSGVSSTQTIAVVPDAKALFVGDLVHHRAHAWLEGAIVGGQPRPDLDAWIGALDELRGFSDHTVHGGRGATGKVEDVVPAQQDYLRGARAIVKAHVAALPDKTVLRGAGAGAEWKAIAAKVGAAYPGHELGYLVEYGVYGLALSL
ncbi:MAG: MBL fold metallo-hydrolase [Myxococcales bacterium]|nr:MBL fold metallo-hydrolase [Myxococcales bacterium]